MPTVNSSPTHTALIAPSKFRGGALLTALFIMTLVAIVATAMSSKLQVDIYRTRLILNHDKLYFASQAVTFWAMSELGDAKKKFSAADSEGMVSIYPKNMASIYPSVTLSGGIYDLQSRFNLNNLTNKKYILGFINFVSATGAQMTPAERMNLALAINNWVSPYEIGVGEDNFLSYYLHQKPPYHPSRQLMISSSELRLVKDVSSKIFLALQPFVTALPDVTALNINTAPKQVLMSLNSTMNEQKVDEFMELRGKNGFTRIEKANTLLKKLNVANDQITLESAYFLSVAHASIENFNFTVYTLLKRNRDKKGKVTVSILRESFNIF
ncbi:type II secretion system minor pseudopilin GspK [Legionella lytica]|uniref:Type II secretion system protein K n=1 Tax=Legionella lytica TaxID=96232 RepID=A0ABW8D573_9GAMM